MMKNKLQLTVAIISMLLFTFAIAITSFQLAIYGDSEYKFYQKEYKKYGVINELPDMSIESVTTVTKYMMSYLIGKKDTLSVATYIEGKQQDFFNDFDRTHMKDVQVLFLQGLMVRNVSFAISVVLWLILAFWIKDSRKLLKRLANGYLLSLAIFGIIAGVVGILFAIDFNKYFVIFHHLFFSQGGWEFDPDVDFMIRMLPEGFFVDILARIGVFIAGGVVSFAIIAVGVRCFINKKMEGNHGKRKTNLC
jgi:integral membrane protein (TIGR01906 family)